jgi:hypothetical protein
MLPRARRAGSARGSTISVHAMHTVCALSVVFATSAHQCMTILVCWCGERSRCSTHRVYGIYWCCGPARHEGRIYILSVYVCTPRWTVLVAHAGQPSSRFPTAYPVTTYTSCELGARVYNIGTYDWHDVYFIGCDHYICASISLSVC